MPSAQGMLKIDDNLDQEPKTTYLTLAHMKCRTKRTFVIHDTMRNFIAKDIDGFFVLSRCPKCDSAVMVQIFRGKKLDKGWSYGIPIQVGDLIVQDDEELMGDKLGGQ